MTDTPTPELPFNIDAPVFKKLDFFNPGILESQLPKDVYDYLVNVVSHPEVRKTAGHDMNINSIKDVAAYPLNNQEKVLENFLAKMFDNWVEEFDIPLPEIPIASGVINAWINYQKKGEFAPIHNHPDSVHFVIFLKVPIDTDTETNPIQYNKTTTADSKDGSFEIVYNTIADGHATYSFALSPDDEGRVLMMPGKLLHQIYPFKSSDEELITVCGNMGVFALDRPQQG